MIYPDTIHGGVEIPDLYDKLLQLDPFTRLRNIRQLGYTPSVYIGAVHSRFEHTIGKTGVLIDLLDRLELKDQSLRDAYITASLLSEIGTYPFSFSTRWLFEDRMGCKKIWFAEQLVKTYINKKHSIPRGTLELMSNHDDARHHWFSKSEPISCFPSLSLLRLSGDIDYALRDGYYSGRYANSFDYRYFRSLISDRSPSGVQQIAESIRELYRAIHSLNSVYGHAKRRFLVLTFSRLVSILIDNSALDIEQFRDPAIYVELDDDRFLAIVRKACEDFAFNSGLAYIMPMFSSIEGMLPFEIFKMDLTQEISNYSLSDLECIIAKNHGVEVERVVAFNDAMASMSNYKQFGSTYKSYRAALESDDFRIRTGLASGANLTGLLEDGCVFYIVIPAN